MYTTKDIIKEIRSQINTPMEEWVLDQCKKISDLQEYLKTPEYKSITSSVLGQYHLTASHNKFFKLMDLGYTKGEVQNAKLCNNKEILAIYKKESIRKLDRIDVAVNKKLKNLEIKLIDTINVSHGLDGFIEGIWEITTTTGEVYKFGFESDLAGGYNIQCLHIRIKYYLKLIK